MNFVEQLLDNSFAQTLGWTLLHFIWQGALVAILLANLNILLRKRTANLRYVLSCAAMLLMLALPVATFITFRVAEPSPLPLVMSKHRISGAAESGATRAADATFELPDVLTPPQALTSSLLPSVLQSREFARGLDGMLPWMVALWMTGVLLLSLRMVGGWAVAQRLKRRQTNPAGAEWQATLQNLCERLRVSRPVRLCQSLLVEVPTVIGWLQPVILVPVRALTGLTPEQLEALLAHELAHIKRHDYLINLLQSIVETLLFYHPAVWWVSHQVRVERENCCDDMAVAACGDVLAYARALAELEHIRTGSGDAPALAMAASGGSLRQRIGRLVNMPASASHRSSPWLAGFIVLATILCIWMVARTDASSRSLAASAPSVFGLNLPLQSSTDVVVDSAASDQSAETKEKASEAEQAREEDEDEAREQDEEDARADADVEDADEGDEAEHRASVDEEDAFDVEQDEDQEGSEDKSKDKSEDKSKDKSVDAGGGDYINELAAEGYTNLPINSIIALKTHGVTRGFIQQMKSLGYSNLSVNKLLAMKIHGVSAQTVEMLKSLGFSNLSPNQLVAARVHGLTPAYVQEIKPYLRSNISFEKLLSLKIHGITPGYIESLKAAGFENISVEQATTAKIHGLSPAFAKAMKEVGYGNLSLQKLVSLRIFGVTPEFVRTVKSRGFDNLSVEQLVELKRLGIINASTDKQ